MRLPEQFDNLPLVEREKRLGELAMTFVREHPLRYLGLCARRIYVTMRSDTIAAVWNATGIAQRFGERAVALFKIQCSLTHWALLMSVFLALYLRRRDLSRNDLILALTIILVAVPFVFVVGGNRYMTPLLPLLGIWVGSAVTRVERFYLST
jgi:hypothetical protein